MEIENASLKISSTPSAEQLVSDNVQNPVKINKESLLISSKIGKVKSIAELENIVSYFKKNQKKIEANIITIEEIEKIAKELKKQGKIIITTNGSFDILHSAHARLLEKAKSLGDILIVLLNSDESVRRNKGSNRPIIKENERALLLTALKPVNYVIIFNDDTPLKYLEIIKPNIHVKGGTYNPERIKEEEDLVKSHGGILKLFELEEGFSSTNIINKILDSYK